MSYSTSTFVAPATQCYVTRHGLDRAMERLSLSKRRSQRIIHLAWERGLREEELAFVKQRRFVALHERILSDGKNELRVYQGHLFIFSHTGSLITMYPLPRDFSRLSRFYDKKRIHEIADRKRWEQNR